MIPGSRGTETVVNEKPKFHLKKETVPPIVETPVIDTTVVEIPEVEPIEMEQVPINEEPTTLIENKTVETFEEISVEISTVVDLETETVEEEVGDSDIMSESAETTSSEDDLSFESGEGIETVEESESVVDKPLNDEVDSTYIQKSEDIASKKNYGSALTNKESGRRNFKKR